MNDADLEKFSAMVLSQFPRAEDADVRLCWQLCREMPFDAAREGADQHRLEFGAKGVWRPDPRRIAQLARAALAAAAPPATPVDRTTTLMRQYQRLQAETSDEWTRTLAVIGATPPDELARATAAAIEAAPEPLRATLVKWDVFNSRPLAALVLPHLTHREAAHA